MNKCSSRIKGFWREHCSGGCRIPPNTIADKVREKCSFGNIIIFKASGLNSLYASGGGVIVSYDK